MHVMQLLTSAQLTSTQVCSGSKLTREGLSTVPQEALLFLVNSRSPNILYGNSANTNYSKKLHCFCPLSPHRGQ